MGNGQPVDESGVTDTVFRGNGDGDLGQRDRILREDRKMEDPGL